MQDTIDIKVLQTLGMARDRFSHRPTGERGRFLSCYRSAGALGCHTRIRAGFPRELSISAENAAAQRLRMFAAQTGAWRGTGPRPTVKAAMRQSSIARDRQSPYVKGRRFFTVAGACHRDVERIMKHPQSIRLRNRTAVVQLSLVNKNE